MEFLLIIALIKYIGHHPQVVLHPTDPIINLCGEQEDEGSLPEIIDIVVADLDTLDYFRIATFYYFQSVFCECLHLALAAGVAHIGLHYMIIVYYGVQLDHLSIIYASLTFIYQLIRMSSSSRNQSRSSFLSTFNWQNTNIKQLLKPIQFSITSDKNDTHEPHCHHTHKNLRWNQAPFLSQAFTIYLDKLTNIKHIRIENFANGSEMTVWIAHKEGSQFVEVYKDKYICKGKTLKNEEKLIDLGALPCQVIKIAVTKGCKISSKNISLVGVDCEQIESALGIDYFRLLVINPLKIIYPDV